MDEDVINDLKQFIFTTVLQATADLVTKDEMNARFTAVDDKFVSLENKMNTRFDKVDKRFDDLELKVDTIADAHTEILEEHSKAIKKLQKQAA